MLAVTVSVFGALDGLLARPRVALRWRATASRSRFSGKVIAVRHAVARHAHTERRRNRHGAGARDFDTLTTYLVVVEWAALVVAVAAVFVLQRTMPDAPRRSHAGYPWVPICFRAGHGDWRDGNRWRKKQTGNYSPMYGLCIAAAGFPVHQVWKRWH